MNDDLHASDQADRESVRFLKNLFTAVRPIIEGNTERYALPTPIRAKPVDPTAPRVRSPFLIEKSNSSRDTSYNIKSSGIAAWKMEGICEALGAFFQQAPAFTAADERGNAYDASSADRRQNAAHLIANFANGTSVYWTAVSGINIHCPSQGVFDQLADHFAPRQPVREI